jgi:ERCC4-type nuclease
MLNDTEKQEKVEKLKKYIDEARKAHDTATVEALGEKLFDLTGVKEPEFDVEVSSGNPKLDRLKKALVQSIAARDEPTEAALRKAGFQTVVSVEAYLLQSEDKKGLLTRIKGIGEKTANAILEVLADEA